MEQQVDKGTPESKDHKSVNAEASIADARTVAGKPSTVLAQPTLEERIEELERAVIFLTDLVNRTIDYYPSQQTKLVVVYG